MRILDDRGVERVVEAGDTVFFPAGTHAQWTVEKYVRKIAFCRSPLPWQGLLAKRAYRAAKRAAKRLLGRGAVATAPVSGPAMFGGQTRPTSRSFATDSNCRRGLMAPAAAARTMPTT